MAVYRMAGLFVEMSPRFDHLKGYAEKYLYKGEEVPDVVYDINVSESVIDKVTAENNALSNAAWEYMYFGAKFAYKLLEVGGFMLHSSAVAYNGGAYLFSADSGTGKSTHTSFWQECFGKENAVIINDDKPALREVDGVFYASGTPFSGKSDLNNDITVPVKAVCFIYRSEKNEIRRIEPSEALELIFNQTVRPKSVELISNQLEILDRFLKKVPVYSLGVTYSPDAARFAYEALKDGKV